MVRFFGKKDKKEEPTTKPLELGEPPKRMSFEKVKEEVEESDKIQLGWRGDTNSNEVKVDNGKDDIPKKEIEPKKEEKKQVKEKKKGIEKYPKKEEEPTQDDDGEKELEREAELEKKVRDVVGKSFLGEILQDDGVTDISFNGFQCFIQHNTKGRYLSEIQPTENEVSNLMKRIASVQGVLFTDSNPILDTEISGLRINAVHKIISPFGVTMALRVSKPYRAIRDLDTLANKHVSQLLDVLLQADTNMIISGMTGSGKTELQKLLVGFIPQSKKISLLEDTMDSHLKMLYPEKDINSWRTRTGENIKNKITFRDLIKAGLRNNPDWLLISEIRGEEAYDFIESALTGHSVLTTVHANGAEAIPSRIRNMIGQRYDMNPVLLGQDIVNNVRFGLHMEMVIKPEGVKRRIREIVEYISYEETGVESKTIYAVHKKYDEGTGEYVEGFRTSGLTEKTCNILKEKELYHLVPKFFRYGAK